MNEITENQKSSEHFIKERNEMETNCKKAQQNATIIDGEASCRETMLVIHPCEVFQPR